MKTLAEIANAIIEQMGKEEQAAYLATMATGKRPSRPPRPKTVAEKWWWDKLDLRHEEVWLTETTFGALVDDFIERTGFEKPRHSAATTIGVMLKKVCPDIRHHNGKCLMPTLKQARRAMADVFPVGRPVASAPGGPEEESGPTLLVDGKTVKVLKTTIIE